MDGRAGVEAAGECEADFLPHREILQNIAHGADSKRGGEAASRGKCPCLLCGTSVADEATFPSIASDCRCVTRDPMSCRSRMRHPPRYPADPAWRSSFDT